MSTDLSQTDTVTNWIPEIDMLTVQRSRSSGQDHVQRRSYYRSDWGRMYAPRHVLVDG